MQCLNRRCVQAPKACSPLQTSIGAIARDWCEILSGICGHWPCASDRSVRLWVVEVHSCHYANESDIIAHRTRPRPAFTAMRARTGGFHVGSIEPRACFGGTRCNILI